jgi:hypothetical protein
LPGQWRFLPRWNCSAFSPGGETRSCPEIAHIQQFRVCLPLFAGPHYPYLPQ